MAMRAVVRPPLVPGEGLWSRLDQRGRLVVVCCFAAALAVLSGKGHTVQRALIGASGLLVFLLIALSGRRAALTLIVVWLALLGLVRRFLIPFAGWSSQDPLLLVSPAAAVTFWATAKDEVRVHRSALSGLAMFLMLTAIVQVFNPAATSLTVSLQGLLFYFVPLMWFFAGRVLGADEHDRVMRTLFGVTAVVVAHGFYQTFVGFLPFELTWLRVSGQGAAIFLPGFKVRPFSTLVSPQEYGYFLVFGIMVIWSRILHPPAQGRTAARRSGLFAFFVAAMVALFFQGARGTFMFCLLGLAVVTVARFRSIAAVLAIGAVLGSGYLVLARHATTPATDDQARAKSTASVLVQHELSGLTNPGQSTAPLHAAQIVNGFQRGLRDPLGAGVASETIAQVKAEGARPTPENDLGNTTVALGMPAGLALLAMVMAGVSGALRMYRRRPTVRHLAWVGMFVAAFGQWLNGGMYAVSALLFLSLGGLAREVGEMVHGEDRALPAGGPDHAVVP